MNRWVVVVLWMAGLQLRASAVDVTVRTDHPFYPGEGAFQTVQDCVTFATSGAGKAEQDQALALYHWLLTHQWHLMSPMEWCVPGRTPDNRSGGDYESVVFDASRARFSYGYGLCGTVHAWNEPYWKTLGFGVRRRAFPGHVNSEVFYGGSWHAFDTDMAGLLFRSDGVVAGYADIQNNPSIADSGNAPIVHYPFAWPSDFKTMQAGWKQVARKPHWYSLYNGGYEAHPGIVDLRPGETFTRWYDRDHYGGPTRRRFWHHQPGGPERHWTFYDNGTPWHNADGSSNARGLATYCNGEFDYRPLQTDNSVRRAIFHSTGEVKFRSSSPRLHSANEAAASVTFRHFSPYVICGDPVDDANPMSGEATDGLVVSGERTGHVAAEVSVDEGLSWQTVQLGDGPGFRIDLTEQVKGRYGWQIRFSWEGKAGIDELRFQTTTQVSQTMYPRLSPNGSEVTVQQKPRSVIAVLPNWGLTEKKLAAVEVAELRSSNLRYAPRSEQNRVAYSPVNSNAAHVVFRMDSSSPLLELVGSMRYRLPIPPPEDCSFELQVSLDEGRSWKTFARADVPADNEYSSGWLAGSTSIEGEQKAALIRCVMHAPQRKSGLIDARFYAIREAPHPRRITAEFGWYEDGQLKTHPVVLSSDSDRQTRTVPTGADIEDRFMRLSSQP